MVREIRGFHFIPYMYNQINTDFNFVYLLFPSFDCAVHVAAIYPTARLFFKRFTGL